MHENHPLTSRPAWVANDGYLKRGERATRIFVCVGTLLVFLSFLSYQLAYFVMWWRNPLTGTAVALSSLLAVGATYIDPAVLDACPGYVARSVSSSRGGSEVSIGLSLPEGAEPCAVFGRDIENLTVTVTYESATRLHVKITDANSTRYEVPGEVFPRPRGSTVPPSRSDLKFSYTRAPHPFSFTITRASTNEVLFTTAGHSLIFEDQYLRVKTPLPETANIYGLGEHSEWFRLDTDNGGKGTTRTLWTRDSFGIPTDSNLYGAHPIYFDHRTTGTHGVFLLNSNGMDVKLNQTSPRARSLEYNVIGGVLDFYFLAGSTTDPAAVSRQYSELSGRAAEVPYWSLGLHQCRYGYRDYVEVANVIQSYRDAGIPLETMWTDIDYMKDRLIFTVDPTYFPMERVRDIVANLHANGQKYIVMTDPAVGYLPDAGYAALDRGTELDIWLKNRNGSHHLGVVWPGVTVFPDWFHPQTQNWWNDEFRRFYSPEAGIDIDGVWIDMNEPASFCDFPCTDPYAAAREQNLPPARLTPAPAPDAPIFTGSSANAALSPRTFESTHSTFLSKRQESPVDVPIEEIDRHLLLPPYEIANSFGPLSAKTAYTNILHANNLTEYDTHNIYGSMMSTATRTAMLARRPNRRPFVITRSTFAGAGHHVGKWLGDNLSNWDHYRRSIAEMLNYAALFNVPVVGSDVCGFGENTTETLCARWAVLGAFNPFYRNHNIENGISQEFYVWPLTTQAAKAGIDIRYRLLDYLYTALHASHVDGSPSLSPLWFSYPKDTTTFGIDLQFIYGPSIIVSPVTEENSTSVRYYLPRDTFYVFDALAQVTSRGDWVTQNDVGYDQVPMHIKGGSIIPLRAESAMTTTELRTKPFNIDVAPDASGRATGELYVDDGETIDPAASRTTQVTFRYSGRRLSVQGRFGYDAGFSVGWNTVRIGGQNRRPLTVLVDGRIVRGERVRYNAQTKVVEVDVDISRLRAFDLLLL